MDRTNRRLKNEATLRAYSMQETYPRRVKRNAGTVAFNAARFKRSGLAGRPAP